jgi:hypothetical protein
MSSTTRAEASVAETAPALDAEEFVRFFSEGWAAPKPDGFIEHFSPRMAPGVRMIQPMAPTTHGVAGFEALFRGLFELFPDYEVRVEDWAARGNVVFLWLRHSTTIGRRQVSWPGIDRIALSADGLIEEREALFDPTVQLPAILRAPRIWPRMIRLMRAG